MNKLKGKVVGLSSSQNIFLAKIEVDRATILDCLAVGNLYVEIGKKVSLGFKETEVAIAKDYTGKSSICNILPGTIVGVEMSKILTRVEIDFYGNSVIAIITTESSLKLGLQEQESISWLLQAGQITIMEK